MLETAIYVLFGYLSGSVLYARVFTTAFRKKGAIESSKDQNPGTANAFLYGGFWCGMLTLVGDLLKGFLPVFLFARGVMPKHPDMLLSALVMAAPVVGHAFPVFYEFKGGKGIAVSFGCLLGLVPFWKPVAVLALFFIFFSVVLKVTPHFHRTLVTYLCSLAVILCMSEGKIIKAGFFIITVTVCGRLLLSKEKRQDVEVKLLWRH